MSALGEAVLSAYRHLAPSRVQAKLDEDAVSKYRSRFQYDQDGLATEHSNGFMSEPRFARAYSLGKATRSWGNTSVHWRAHTYLWAASVASRIEGDFVECGVNRGGFARATIDYLDFGKLARRFFLLDTYDGFVERLLTPEEKAMGRVGGGYEPCLDDVRQTFAPFPFTVIIPGAVPDTLPQITAEKIAFLSIDMNCAEPERAALDYLWPKVSPGGVILFDDYGFLHHGEQKKVHDAFARRTGLELLALPTGQGLTIKPIN